MHIQLKRFLTLLTSVCVLTTTTPGIASAVMLGTQTALSIEHRVEQIDRISRWLMRDEVSAELIQLGVEPSQAQKRVAAMSDAELQHLSQRIHNLPAGGGVLEVIGIVFVVLIILELLGVSNVFSRL